MSRSPGKREEAVFDTSPLIFLSRLHLLERSLDLFSESLLAESVRVEVVDQGKTLGTPEVTEVEALLASGRLVVRKAPATAVATRLKLNPKLSKADRDTLAIASEAGRRVLADDAAVRSVARQLGLPLGGTLSVLFSLVDSGRLESTQAIELLDQLVDAGWYCSAQLYRAARKALEDRLEGK